MSVARRKALRDLARRRYVERLLTSVAALVIVPGTCAILGAFTPDLRSAYGSGVLTAIWIAVLFILAALAIRLNPAGETLLGLAVENEDQEELIVALKSERDQLRNLIDTLALQANYGLSVRSAVLSYSRQVLVTVQGLEKAVHDLASPVYLEGEFIFGLGPSEAWSFAVYLYSKQRDLLIPIWRRKSQNHKSAQGDLGREWGRGEGHVGKAFVDQRMIITGDAQHPDAEPFSAVPPNKEKPYDKTLYRSFASVPIGPLLAEDLEPYGVLVATSDRIGRFGRANSGMLVQIAGAIASLLSAGHVNIDDLSTTSNRDHP